MLSFINNYKIRVTFKFPVEQYNLRNIAVKVVMSHDNWNKWVVDYLSNFHK